MNYDVNSYQALSGKPLARLEVFSGRDVETFLSAAHQEAGARRVAVRELLEEDSARLPTPVEIFDKIRKVVGESDRPTVLCEIEPYLSLLDDGSVKQFLRLLRERLEKDAPIIFLLSLSWFKKYENAVFRNPRFENSARILRVVGDAAQGGAEIAPPSVVVYPERFAPPDYGVRSCGELLKALDDASRDDPSFRDRSFVAVLRTAAPQAGLGANVRFVFDLRKIARLYDGFQIDFPLADDVVAQFLLECKERRVSPREFARDRLGGENWSLEVAFRKLFEYRDDPYWGILVDYVKTKIDRDSYLAFVLRDLTRPAELLRKYVVDAPASLVRRGSPREIPRDKIEAFAAERFQTLDALNAPWKSLLDDLIARVQDDADAALFLNCQTNAERSELIRRAGKVDLTNGLPEALKTLYPGLDDYLSSGFYPNDLLESYFQEYRRNRVRDDVAEDFVQRAFELSSSEAFARVRPPIRRRDEMLAPLSVQEDVALLVVDGMGAEYLPFLVRRARALGLDAEKKEVVEARLPTTTERNPIEWSAERRLPGIYQIDNIAHDGVAKNENRAPEESLCESLNVLDTELFTRVEEGLKKFSKVVVTADHGASRLAVVARRLNLCRTLPWSGDVPPDDWRYAVAPKDAPVPEEMEQSYSSSDDRTYWTVKGYDRLPKQGPKLRALHGGASPEERFVPLVVLTRKRAPEAQDAPSALEAPPTRAKSVAELRGELGGERDAEQLIEKDDFSDL